MAELTRIAPTPSGYLHEGNLFAFALCWLMARKEGLQILLRIDDMDRARFRPEYLEDIFRSLDALGIDYDQGPAGVEDFEKNWSQNSRMELYQNAAKQFENVFQCSCSRKEILERNPQGFYDGFCLDKKFKEPKSNADFAIRWNKNEATVELIDWQGRISSNELPDSMRFPILWTKANYPSYQLCSLVDDEHFKTTHIVRGRDLWNSSICQLALAQELGHDRFVKIRFHHHPLIQKGSQKLSKSQASPAAEIYRKEAGQIKLLNKLSAYLGLPLGSENLNELLQLYRIT